MNLERPAIDPTQVHQVAEFKHEEPLTTLRADPTGNHVASGAQDLNVQLWRVSDGTRQTLKGHDSWVRSIEFSSDGSRLYTACWGGVVKAWDISGEAAKLIYSIQAHQGSARWVRRSPDDKFLVTCGNDLLVKIWNAVDGKPVQQFSGHKRHVYGADFHPDGGRVLSQDLLGVIKTWNLSSGKEDRTITADMMTGYDLKFAADMGGSRDLSFSADGTQWASAGITKLTNGFAGDQDPVIVVFNWKTGQVTQQLGSNDDNFKGIAWGVRFHPGGFLIGAGASKKGTGELWFYKPGEASAFHTFKLRSAARALDLIGDDRLAVAHHDGHVRLYTMTPAPPATES